MRAILAVIALAITLVGGVSPAPVAAAAPDNTGPACTDIKGGDGIYSSATGNAVFTFSFEILAPPCKNATYTLRVTDSNGGTVTASYPAGDLTRCGLSADGLPQFCFTHNYGVASSAPTAVTVTGESTIGGHLADTTPPKEYVLDGPIGDNSWDQ